MTTNLITFSSAEVALKWQEPYLSQGINREMAVAAPVGIHRGFRLKASGAAMSVTVEADSTWGDNAAVCRVLGGYALTVSRTGSFDISLSAYASKTVVLAINASYALNTSTTAYITAYELSPSDEFNVASEKPYLVVLGTVTVPASGTISSTSIQDVRRTEAWDLLSPPEIAPVQLISNPSFELADTSGKQYSIWHWTRGTSETDGSSSYWQVATTDPASGLMHLQLSYTSIFPGAVTSSLSQPIMTKVSGGESLRLSLKVKALKVATGGSLLIRLHFLTETGAVAPSSPVSYSVPLTAVDSTYRTLSQMLTVPTGGVGGASFLSHIEIRNAGLTAGTDGIFVRLDDIELWFDKRTARQQMSLDTVKQIIGPALSLMPDPSRGDTVSFASDIAKSLLMRLDPSTTEATVLAGRRDGGTSNYPLLDWKGRMKVGTGIATGILPFLATPYDDVGVGVVPVTAIWEGYPADGAGTKVRIYVNSSGDLYFTLNAGATSSTTLTWQKDVTGKPAWKFTPGSTVTNATPKIDYRGPDDNANWVEANWTPYWRPVSTTPSPVKTSGFTVSIEFGFWPCNTTGAAFNAILPPPVENIGRTIVFKDVAGKFGTNNLTIVRNGAERIEGLSSNFVCNADFQEVRLYCDGTDWWLI